MRAPTALRMPISRVRSDTLTSMMFMMPMPPTSSEMLARPASIAVSVPRIVAEEAERLRLSEDRELVAESRPQRDLRLSALTASMLSASFDAHEQLGDVRGPEQLLRGRDRDVDDVVLAPAETPALLLEQSDHAERLPVDVERRADRVLPGKSVSRTSLPITATRDAPTTSPRAYQRPCSIVPIAASVTFSSEAAICPFIVLLCTRRLGRAGELGNDSVLGRRAASAGTSTSSRVNFLPVRAARPPPPPSQLAREARTAGSSRAPRSGPVIWLWTPVPIDTSRMTAATPMMTPSIVSALRTLFALERPDRDAEALDEVHACPSRSRRGSRASSLASSVVERRRSLTRP